VAGASARLTPREKQVLELLCQGLADKEVAAQLGIKCVTVRTYVSRLQEKLGATNRTQLGQAAVSDATDGNRAIGQPGNRAIGQSGNRAMKELSLA
jgi:DNA-binding NarL/FixJ family response regulator